MSQTGQLLPFGGFHEFPDSGQSAIIGESSDEINV
jgi:hypothetical protein